MAHTIYKNIPIEFLKPGTYQPRRSFDHDHLKELADSIQSQGLIEPIIVRAKGKNEYEIIAGERRWRAAQLAGLIEVPCLVNDCTNEEAQKIALIENIQRQNLNLIEEASGYERLISEFNFSQEEVAKLIGKSRSHIANLLRLLTLSDSVLEKIKTNQLSLGHARMLVGLCELEQKKICRKNPQ